LGTVNALLETQELEFQDEPALERALGLHRQGSADFADCLHAGQCGSAGRTPMVTFDETAAPCCKNATSAETIKPSG
jgi:predicted nucleic-acid-binding protein